MKLNLRQAIKMVAQLREDLNKEQEKISNQFTTPLVVNGEKVVSRSKNVEVNESYEKIANLTSDIIDLRNEISKANSDKGLSLHNIALQELRKLNRNIERQLNNSQYISGSDVVSGVGVVEKGIIKEYILLDMMKKNQAEMNQIQNELDEANNNIVIEVHLRTV